MPAWAAAVFVPVMLAAIAATWKLANTLGHNTQAITDLRTTVDANAVELRGVSDRMIRLETVAGVVVATTGRTAASAAVAADRASSTAQAVREVRDAVTG